MKNSYILILLMTFLLGCKNTPNINNSEKRNENWCWLVDAKTGQGNWIPVGDETTVANGNYTMFFCNGQIRAKGKLINGKQKDTIFYFNIKGVLISKKFKNKNGELQIVMEDGIFKNHYASCELMSEGEFKNNKPIGTTIEYYKNGNIKHKAIPLNDTTWTVTEFYESGKTLDSFTLVNEKTEGIRKLWYPNGKIKQLTRFQNNLEEGVSSWYYDNGQISLKCNFNSGIENGIWVEFHKNGTLKSKRFLKNGKDEGISSSYYENGQLRSKIIYSNGVENGDVWFYHSNGQLEMQATAKNDIRADFKWFDEKGELIKEHHGILE